MRLWTLHPMYLDTKGLVALWRESLLAQAVLQGNTRGYRQHPQLVRFQHQDSPLAAIATYLEGVYEEAKRRGYRFDASKIGPTRMEQSICETQGQLLYEWSHLQQKLALRNPTCYQELESLEILQAHPLFRIGPREVQDWERR